MKKNKASKEYRPKVGLVWNLKYSRKEILTEKMTFLHRDLKWETNTCVWGSAFQIWTAAIVESVYVWEVEEQQVDKFEDFSSYFQMESAWKIVIEQWHDLT